jgi:hypothetical protein
LIPPSKVTSLKKYVQEQKSAASIVDFRLSMAIENSLHLGGRASVKEINISQVRTTTKSLEPLISN